MTLLAKLQALLLAIDELLTKTPQVQAELTALNNFLDSI